MKRLCRKRSADGYCCTFEHDHTGPCSRVLWKLDGNHVRVYWWDGCSASENLGRFIRPDKVELGR